MRTQKPNTVSYSGSTGTKKTGQAFHSGRRLKQGEGGRGQREEGLTRASPWSPGGLEDDSGVSPHASGLGLSCGLSRAGGFRGPALPGRLSTHSCPGVRGSPAGEACVHTPPGEAAWGPSSSLQPVSVPPSVTAVALWTGFLDLLTSAHFLELDPALL